MAAYLTFQLYGPMSSWGDIAVGEARVSSVHPSRSALLGLMSAALGLTRQDDAQLTALADAIRLAVLVLNPGHFMRDYHTAQVPPANVMKKRPAFTRRDELAVTKDELGTILSVRDYRIDAYYLIALELHGECDWILEDLLAALYCPIFPLYLGRKCCPPALPLAAQIVDAENLLTAIRIASVVAEKSTVAEDQLAKLASVAPYSLYWEEGMHAGIAAMQTTSRRDQPRSRRRWQFDERIEHHAMIDSLEA